VSDRNRANIVLFEDEETAGLNPIALGRPAFELSCGGYRLVELAARFGCPLRAEVRPHLRPLLAAAAPAMLESPPPDSPCVFLHARLAPIAASLERLRPWIEAARPFVALRNGAPIAGCLGRAGTWADLGSPGLPAIDFDHPLIEHPHDVIRFHALALVENLGDRIARGGYRELAPGVFAADDVSIHPSAVFDASRGPIVIEHAATIGPLAVVHGPCRLGPQSVVNDHASLRPGVTAERGCRLGGEVSNSVLEPFANKQHFGFLGDSYVGAWVNLGAGTTNSNLKNTYGLITMRYAGRSVPTDMQFLGTMIGDYAKTAVGTMIYTGKVIGAGSMVYGTVQTNIPSFVNHVPPPGRPTAIDYQVLAAAQRRMFGRRNQPWTEAHTMVLRAMFDLTAAERVGLEIAPPDFGPSLYL